MAPFGSRLAAAMAARGPLCVGIDPYPELMRAWGLPTNAPGLERFAFTAAEALAGEIAVVKPQSAFFEAYGSAGIAVLERLIEMCRQAGALVLLDAKRGEIGSTMTAYAQAYLSDDAPLAVDAMTVSPYLGFGSLTPLLDQAERNEFISGPCRSTSRDEVGSTPASSGPNKARKSATVAP